MPTNTDETDLLVKKVQTMMAQLNEAEAAITDNEARARIKGLALACLRLFLAYRAAMNNEQSKAFTENMLNTVLLPVVKQELEKALNEHLKPIQAYILR